MGKLSDLIKRTTRVEPRALGFGAATRKSQPTMVLVAVATERWARSAADAVAAGADALLLTGRPGDKDAQEAATACAERPCGVLVPDATPEQLDHLREAGIDFAIIGGAAAAGATAEEQLTLGFSLRDDLSDIQLRALEALPFDVVYIEREPAVLTVMRLVELQRIAGLARKPIIAHVAGESEQADLVALRGAGVTLLAVDMKERSAVDTLRKLRETIDDLPRPKARQRDERASVSLPRAAAAPEHNHDDEDEE